MTCSRCGKKTEKGWRFCPNCGSSIQQRSRSMFDEIFSRFRKDFAEMNKAFDSDFEVLDLSPFFRKRPQVKSKGFTIKITRRGGERPNVNVQTFGNVDKEEIRKHVGKHVRSMGIQGLPIPASQRQPAMVQHPAGHAPGSDRRGKVNIHDTSKVKTIEEPKAKVMTEGGRVLVEMDLPDVKSESDIEVRQLESSVEVRARAGDKAYFKIITKPEQFSVSSKSFEKGKLHLEFS